MGDPDDAAGAAFERFVLPEIDLLLRVARSLTRNAAEAEDLVQDTLLRAYRGIDGFDGSYPRAWLLTILRNTHINRNRRRRPELLRDTDTTLEQLADTSGDDRADAFIDRSIDTVVLDALHALDDRVRIVVELVDVDGLSYAEAADVLDVPVGTVMSRLHRARRRIREQLEASDSGSGSSPRVGEMREDGT